MASGPISRISPSSSSALSQRPARAHAEIAALYEMRSGSSPAPHMALSSSIARSHSAPFSHAAIAAL